MKRLLGTILAALTILLASLITPAEAADRPYLAQYRQPDRTVCVEINTSRTWLRDKVKSAAYQFDSKTDLRMWTSKDCNGNHIKVKAGYYGKNGHRAWNELWVYPNGVIARSTVYLNLSYYAQGKAGTYALQHEFAHGVLGTRHTSYCGLMYRNWSGCGTYWLTKDVIRAVNYTY